MPRLLVYLAEKIIPKNNIQYPGRWIKKEKVEYWFQNYHPDPGYQNKMKHKWIENLKNNNFTCCSFNKK